MGISPQQQRQGGGVEGFERVFDLVGGHGIFQWRLLLIVSLQLIVLTWHHIGYSFLGTVPNHWCSIPELQQSINTNWTIEQIKQISIPPVVVVDSTATTTTPSTTTDNNPNNPHNKSSIKYKKCEHYDLDFSNLLASYSTFEEAYNSINWNDDIPTKPCQSWQYDDSIYKSTVATEFNLVCNNRWKAATIQGSYMAGGLIGTLTFGSLSDKILGRRNAVLIALILVIIGGIIASFASNYWIFLALRMIISIGVSGSMQNCFVLVTEHADKEYRAMLALVEQVAFAVGYMILPGLAYYFRYWDSLQLSFGLISIGLTTYYWILPESPRWLATHGQGERSVRALYKIAKVNKLPKPNRGVLEEIVRDCACESNNSSGVATTTTTNNTNDDEESIETTKLNDQNHHHHQQQQQQQQKKSQQGTTAASVNNKQGSGILHLIKRGALGIAYNFSCLMRTGEIRKRSAVFWFLFMTVAMVYYGIVFSGNLTSDPYLLVFLGGLMEVPAYTVVVPFVSRLGRRPTTSGTFILTGVCMIGLSQTPMEYEVIRIVLAMAAKLFISSGFAIIYLLGAELYPTEFRTTGLAVGVFMGRVGAISAPYIVDLLSTIFPDLPTVIFGSFAVAAGFVGLLLPETKTLEMSDKVTEIEMHAEEVKAKERDRKLSWVIGE